MKVIRKSQSKEYRNGNDCVAYEYQLGDKDINGAVIEINGRYPSTGRVVNLQCKELAFVINGLEN